ncbi:MAG: triphosphoribosyl-dephospho-CoA synthase [Candidatus Bathyarchaeia archaeon]
MKFKELVEYVRQKAELASVLEVSGWPKPGNVHRTRNYGDSKYEHFLAGAIALGPSIKAAALRGIMAASGKIDLSDIGLGRLIKRAVTDILSSHNGGNTHLGVCLLFIPLSASAAKTYVEEKNFSLSLLRRNFDAIMRAATPVDAVKVYEAIAIAGTSRDLGRVSCGRAPDIYDPSAAKKIMKGGITLFDVMLESSAYDMIARELVTGMEITFNIGFKELVETFNCTKDINVAIVHTFLKILSEYPDTFIARKIGLKRESEVRRAVELGVREIKWLSEEARRILDLGGLTTERGKAALWSLDDKLHEFGEDYNPGTTADITAASIMVALLTGLKF